LDVKATRDRQSGIFMVKGSQAKVQRFLALVDELKEQFQKMKLTRLDVIRHVNAQAPRAIRIIWFTTEELDSKGGAALALDKDATAIGERLNKLGFSKLSPKAQFIARCEASERGVSNFQIQGSVPLGDKEIVVSTEGSITTNIQHESRAQIQILVKDKSDVSLTELKAEVNLVLGKSIVLGSAPIGRTQSVFVIQSLDAL
jgi:hypothetical protein